MQKAERSIKMAEKKITKQINRQLAEIEKINGQLNKISNDNVSEISADKISIDKIPVLNGYVGITDKKIAIHYAKNKAKIITAKDVVSVKSSIKPLIDLNILKIDNVLDVPKENVPLIVGSVFAYNQASAILKFKKPYLKNKLNVNQSDYISFYNKSISVFNILSLCLFIIKNIIGKIYESTKRK